MSRLLDRHWGWVLAGAAAAAIAVGAVVASASSPPRVDSSRWDETSLARPSAAGVLGKYCTADGLLPDRRCTPGITDPLVDDDTVKTTICRPGWAATEQARVLPPDNAAQVTAQVAAAYEVNPAGRVLTWLVPVGLGGQADYGNLWLLPAVAAREKAAVDAAAVRQVCAGRTTLSRAQQRIRDSWPAYGAALHAKA